MSSTYSVCLGPSNNGWFTLSWSAAGIGKHDWVGLYANASDDDSKYIGGHNWQWATNGTSYVTSTAVQPGYQARYLIWDASMGKYVSVARTPAYPAAVCSS
ncbi:hypothetical protein [Archangium sp.]|uniref:hypothetical protein n=1 Tax=Archangium sp. TaxID=1872627 RepID=UPI002D6EAF5F|nr:hypothetical protein [Archangium sp.]HYO57058.1 hypothetical protein [Archangium sp.]